MEAVTGEGRNPEEKHKIRERLTSIARSILAGGNFELADRAPSVKVPENDKDAPPFMNRSEPSGARTTVPRQHYEHQKLPSASPEKWNALGLSASPVHTPKSHSPPPHHFQATFSDHSISVSNNNKHSAASTPKHVSFDSPRPAVSPPLPPILTPNGARAPLPFTISYIFTFF